MRIAVDLLRLRGGGETGGAGALAIGVIRSLAALGADREFLLVTQQNLHQELAALFEDSPNVRLVSADPGEDPPQAQFISDLDADLLFCPFTAPTLALADPRVPVVSVVCDLQQVDYPYFFSDDDRTARNTDLSDAAQRADRIICISDFTRSRLLKYAPLSAERTTTIPIGVAPLRTPLATEQAGPMLDRLGLVRGRFLLYPANFWAHKNHRMLATAFALYRQRHPHSDLKLVCTGALEARLAELRRSLERTEVADWIVLPGYVPRAELGMLMQTCLAFIFPSLYEGFGMPVVEAMQTGKPVLCSNRTSLPEVTGDAALLFDPERPTQILTSIERIEADPALASRLVELGAVHVRALPTSEDMARAYWRVFEEVVSNHRPPGDAAYGVYSDGWTGKRVVVTYGAHAAARSLELVLTAPDEAPFDTLHMHVTQTPGKSDTQTFTMKRGETCSIVRNLDGQGAVEVRFDPPFQPAAHGSGRDRRILGCVCKAVRLVGPGGDIDLLARGSSAPD